MSKILKAFSQYRIEITYSIIAFSGSAILCLQFQSTENFAWFIALSFFCTRMITGIYNYEYYRKSNTPSMKVMLKHLLIKFV
ncbi:hypothetical protein ATS72_001635 [Pseudoalteromonas sp. 13-15]|nr:hypothetical protein CPA52_10360 [Pseudoalteromonas marina]AUL72374.1 hypothetical protein ATS72_001635 [Pseudoalteromonas sp. 13-15]OUS73180.1 hypothetical protein B5G52_05625 [Pseudoalteromonas sp. A601]